MTPEQEQKVLASLYDRLHDAITYSPDGKSSAFPKNVYFQMTKNTVLSPADFADMVSPENPNGDQLTAEAFSAMVNALPKPGALWSDSGKKLSDVLTGILAQANTDSKPTEAQQKDYQAAYDFLNTKTTTKDYKGNEKSKIDPSPIAIEYDNAETEYVTAVSAFRTAYNGYDLTKKEDQRAWNAAAPTLQNLVNKTWNAWVRSGKEEVEGAQAAMASTINDAVRFAIDQSRAMCGDQYRLPSATPAGLPWFPSYALPTSWALADTKGAKLQFSSAYMNKTESETAHGYGLEMSGSYGLFHASGGVEGEHKTANKHMDAQNLTLEAELIAVTVMRPWFNPLLFGMNSWWVNGYVPNGISNGDPRNPLGEAPLIPTGFVIAKNVKVSADFSEEDKKFVSNSISTKASGGWGPFSVSGKYSHSSSKSDFQSKFDGGSLIFPGLQIVAWISTVTPASPPLAARVAAR